MNLNTPNILVVDDEPSLCRTISRSLGNRIENCNIEIAHDPKQALLAAKRLNPEVIILDLSLDSNQGQESGLSLIPVLYQHTDASRIIVLTGAEEKEWGIKSINAGASSFLSKPADMDMLASLVKDALQVSRLLRGSKSKARENLIRFDNFGFETKCPKMQETLEQAAFLASTPLPILLVGETGVGKGLIASAIHKASRSASGPYIRVQPRFGSHDMILAELFGHTKGAFTFYHRISSTIVHIPPLRERRADIPILAEKFLQKLRADNPKSTVGEFSRGALVWLGSQAWAGNVRELQATVARGFAKADVGRRRIVHVSDFKFGCRPEIKGTSSISGGLSEQLKAYELSLTAEVLARNDHNRAAAALELRIDRKRLNRILARLES